MQFLGNILEVDNRINIQYGFTLFRLDVFLDIGLETSAELLYISPFHCHSGGIGMSAEVQQQVTAALDG